MTAQYSKAQEAAVAGYCSKRKTSKQDAINNLIKNFIEKGL